MGQNAQHRFTLVLMMGLVSACQAYEINYVGQTQIVEQKIKTPDMELPGQYDRVVRDNTAFHFTLENMETKGLDTDFTSIEAFICGQSEYESNLLSALYFPDEIKFVGGPPVSQTNKSFYGIFVPYLLADMKENAKTQNKQICAKIVYQQTWELKKTSNLVVLGKLK